MKEYTLNIHGEVTSPSLHDSKLISVKMDDSVIRLSFKTCDEVGVYCYLNGVEQFVCNNLRQGNITLDLTVIKSEVLSESLKLKLFPSSKVKNEKFDKYLESMNDRLQKNEIIIIQLNPSYGCEINAICSSINFKIVK